jgi:hypothetical protein
MMKESFRHPTSLNLSLNLFIPRAWLRVAKMRVKG